MKQRYLLLYSLIATLSTAAHGQGTFLYDQQSADETRPGEYAINIQNFSPLGQSFTPSLDGVGFVRLETWDVNNNNGLGATLFVRLRDGSIGGSILGTSEPVSLPDGFGNGVAGFTDFIFPSAVPVTPGTTYYFEVVAQGGSDFWQINYGSVTLPYAGGTAIFSGTPNSQFDLWFREGVIVPEPSSISLLSLASIGLFLIQRKGRNRSYKSGR